MSGLKQYIQSNPRNKLVFCTQVLEEFEFVDIGYALSLAIRDEVEEANIAGWALDELNNILNNNVHAHSEYGDYVAITNIGILLEPELKIDISNLFEQYSKSVLFIVCNKDVQLPKITTTSIQL